MPEPESRKLPPSAERMIREVAREAGTDRARAKAQKKTSGVRSPFWAWWAGP